VGANSLEKVSKFSESTYKPGNPASALEAKFENEKDKTSYPGFCLQTQKRNDSTGCDFGTRYENIVTIRNKEKNTDPLVNTFKVIWIMKWW
jgi:hypothetical protein